MHAQLHAGARQRHPWREADNRGHARCGLCLVGNARRRSRHAPGDTLAPSQVMRSSWSTTTLQQTRLMRTSSCVLQASCRSKPLPDHTLCCLCCPRPPEECSKKKSFHGGCTPVQGLEGGHALPQAAELQRRRRRHLLQDVAPGANSTPGASFDMAMLQQTSDPASSCTPRYIWTFSLPDVQAETLPASPHACTLCACKHATCCPPRPAELEMR